MPRAPAQDYANSGVGQQWVECVGKSMAYVAFGMVYWNKLKFNSVKINVNAMPISYERMYTLQDIRFFSKEFLGE